MEKSIVRLPTDEDTLHHHSDLVKYLSYLLKYQKLNHHSSPIGCGWENIGRKYHSVRYAVPATAVV